MISVWGITHPDLVTKSYLGNGVWEKASQLKKLGSVPAAHARIPGQASGRKLWPNTPKTKPGVSADVHQPRTDAEVKADGAVVSGTSTFDGRGNGHVDLYGHTPDSVMYHELAHIAPRRNPFHLQERAVHGTAGSGREEGRANFIGNGHETFGDYPGNDKFQSGYDQVQRRMSDRQVGSQAKRQQHAYNQKTAARAANALQKKQLRSAPPPTVAPRPVVPRPVVPASAPRSTPEVKATPFQPAAKKGMSTGVKVAAGVTGAAGVGTVGYGIHRKRTA